MIKNEMRDGSKKNQINNQHPRALPELAKQSTIVIRYSQLIHLQLLLPICDFPGDGKGQLGAFGEGVKFNFIDFV
jgi:hypothetical protein